MKKKIAIILAILLILSLCIVFCSCNDERVSGRFFIVERGYGTYNWQILCDKSTRVLYLQYSSGITVMLDENGKPLLYEGEIE